MLKFKPTFSFVLALNIIVTSSLAAILFTGDAADAAKPQGYYQGRPYYKDSRGRLIDYKTGKILKGGLIGAGIGAGAGLLTGRSVGRTALVGGGVGAGVQATRHSEFMK